MRENSEAFQPIWIPSCLRPEFWETLEDFVLVGHSYGGWIISGGAEQFQGKISSIVFLDAFMPEGRVLDTNSPRGRAEIEPAQRKAEVSRPAPPASVWKITEKDQPWVNEKFTAQPVGVALTPIRLTGARDRVSKKTYEAYYAKVRSDPPRAPTKCRAAMRS